MQHIPQGTSFFILFIFRLWIISSLLGLFPSNVALVTYPQYGTGYVSTLLWKALYALETLRWGLMVGGLQHCVGAVWF